MDAVRLVPPAALDMPIGEAMLTQRAIRRLDPKRPIGDAQIECCLPLGYPRGNFGLTPRMPTSQTTYWNTWHNAPPWQ